MNNSEVNQKARNTMLSKYGVEYSGQSKKLMDKMRNTNNIKYNTDYYLQTQECRHKNIKRKNIKSKYDDTYFDNENEKLIYDYCKSNGKNIQVQIPIKFNEKLIFVDFKIDGKLYEEKSSFLLSGGFEGFSNFNSLTIDEKLNIYNKLNVTIITDITDSNITKLNEFNVKFLDINNFKEEIK